MTFYADLHIHSKHSRACSRDCDLEHLAWWGKRKGITVIGTGDFTHPAWIEELRATLVPAEPGLFRLREDLERAVDRRLPASCRGPVRFMLSVEISTIYKRDDRTRKVHHLLYAPDLEVAAEITRRLARIGNLHSDGRPILGLDSRDLLEITLESGEGAYLVPAHVWTPWFAALGSRSGFDAVEDCYADLARHVFALETGLSADPEMCWRVSSLDRYRLVSNSDAHSPPILGREASVFATDLDYAAIRRALETGRGFEGTVEFFPQEGKYHLDGHRACGVRLEPAETRRLDGRCPACGKPVTVGVLHRVEALADRPAGARPAGAAGFRSLVPLPEVMGEVLGVGAKSKAVAAAVGAMVERLGPELGILERVPLDAIAKASSPLVAEAVDRLRRGAVVREAGFDGEYGVIRVFHPHELRDPHPTATLFEPEPTVAPGPAEPVPTARPDPAPVAAGPAATPPLEAVPVPDPVAVGTGPGDSPLDALDPDQRAAAAVTEGPLLIVAGPGTGKTRTLAHRLAHLVTAAQVPPERCLAITFTRRACQELAERLAALVGDLAPRMLVTTFHGLGLRILRERHALVGLGPGFRVADEAERLALVRELEGGSERAAHRRLEELAAAKRARAAGTPARTEADRHAAALDRYDAALRKLDRYDAALRKLDLVDLDDLVALPVRLLIADPGLAAGYQARWPHLAVDEYQDVDELQYRLLRLLAPPGGHPKAFAQTSFCAIGDPDQAIYGFRGSHVGFFLRFAEDFPAARTVQLTRNYRSSPAIVAGALQAIAPASLVRDRVLDAAAAVAGPARITLHQAASEQAEAEFVVQALERLLGGSSFFALDSGRADGGAEHGLSFADVAVLYRTDVQAGPVAEALARAGMPFQKRSHDRLLDRAAVRAVVRQLREPGAGPHGDRAGRPATLTERVAAAAEAAAAGPDGEALAADLAAVPELLGPLAARCDGDVERLLAELALGEEVDSWDPRADRVSLLTLHAAKGLEFPVVFLVGCEDGLLPLRGPGRAGDDGLAEERRLFFVGMTRARAHLFLSWARRRSRHGAVRETAPSPFLADIEEALLDRAAGRARAARPARAEGGDQLSLL